MQHGKDILPFQSKFDSASFMFLSHTERRAEGLKSILVQVILPEPTARRKKNQSFSASH